MTSLFYNTRTLGDEPRPWGVYFQDSASPQMEALIELHDNIMFYLVIILFGVAWILFSIIWNYVFSKSPISNKYLNHGTLIELIWTITPALILILIAFPSFKLLYLMDEVTDPSMTLFAEGHQWYWSYQYPDFVNDEGKQPESELKFVEGEKPDLILDDPHFDAQPLTQIERIRDCVHETVLAVPEITEVLEIPCDFNPDVSGEGLVTLHMACKDGVAPNSCTNCHAMFCYECRPADEE